MCRDTEKRGKRQEIDVFLIPESFYFCQSDRNIFFTQRIIKMLCALMSLYLFRIPRASESVNEYRVSPIPWCVSVTATFLHIVANDAFLIPVKYRS